MKIILMAAGVSASLLAGSAYAGVVTVPLGAPLGTALPFTSAGLLSIAAVALVAGVRMLRRKQDK